MRSFLKTIALLGSISASVLTARADDVSRLPSPSFNAVTMARLVGGDTSSATVLPQGASAARPLSNRFADYINVRDYGVKCDGATDDTAAINALFSTRLFRKHVVFPAGTCMFSSTLNISLNSSSVSGAGSQATQFVYTGSSTTADLISVTYSYNPVIQGFSVWSQTKMTSGAALHVSQVSYGWLKDIVATYLNTSSNTLWNGLYIDQPNFVSVDGYYFQAQNDALQVSALGVGTPYQYDVFLNNGKLSDSVAGLHVGGGVDNIHVENTEITSNTINVLDDNALVLKSNQEIFLGKHVVTDQGGQWNYYINDSQCNTLHYGIIEISGPVTAAKTYDNIYVKAFPGCQLIVSSPFVTSAARDGIRSADASAILSVAPQTLITANKGYGINAEFPWSNVVSSGQMLGNTSGAYSSSVIPASLTSPAPQYKFASMPACTKTSQLGGRVYVTDALKPNETSGAGSGVTAECSLSAAGASTFMWVSTYSGKQLAN